MIPTFLTLVLLMLMLRVSLAHSWYTIKIPEEIRVVIENDLSEGNTPTATSPSAPLNLNSNPPTPPSRYLRPAS